jgi:DNA-directed RNA polymerase subunit M/transcription elongation factor TFIIS
MSMTKYGVPDVCPQCNGNMGTVSNTTHAVTRKCSKCGYQATVQTAEPMYGSSTAATPATKEKDSK